MCFVNFKEAFDKVNCKKTVESGGGHRIREPSFCLHTSAMLKLKVKCPYSWRDKWLVLSQQKVRQKCILSPYLFNIMVELLMRKALDEYERGFKIGERCNTNLRYADDIVLIASTENDLQNIVHCLHEAVTKLGIKINGKKTEVIKVCDDPKPITVTVAGCTADETKSLNYLEKLCLILKRRVTRRSSRDWQSQDKV